VTEIPAGTQADRPNIARIHDYLLGGSRNFAADREAAEEFLGHWPDARQTMLADHLAEPGLVPVTGWHSYGRELPGSAEPIAAYGCVGRKR
jgi:hypothetical protein